MKKIHLLTLCLALACSACATIKDSDTYKESRRFYYKHINRPAVVDFTDVAEVKPLDEKLTKSFALLDKELTKLQREMDSILELSNVQAIAGLFTQFPWISHIYALDPAGEIMGAMPSYVPEYADFLYVNDKEIKSREVYADVREVPNGYEIVLLRPYMTSGEVQGFLAVSFDPKSLLPFAGDPSNIVLLSENSIFWTGNHLYEETPFNLDWSQELKNKSYDTVENDRFRGAWLARYYGGTRFVYGIMEEKEQE